MTLSILFCGGLNHMIYDSDADKVLMVGSIGEMETWKHRLEIAEQMQADHEHFERLREEYLQQLVRGGNTPDKAKEFLKERMPFLFA